MRIPIGDYIRTENGLIAKAISSEYEYKDEYKDDYKQDFDNEILNDWYNDEIIVKHSPNIIDLIEVGDYVNGQRVFATDNRINDNGEKVILTENYDEWTDNGVVSNKDIKSIVTKELFKNSEYEV